MPGIVRTGSATRPALRPHAQPPRVRACGAAAAAPSRCRLAVRLCAVVAQYWLCCAALQPFRAAVPHSNAPGAQGMPRGSTMHCC